MDGQGTEGVAVLSVRTRCHCKWGYQDRVSSVQSLGSENWGKCGRYEVGWYSCHWSMVGEALGGLWPWILNTDDVLKIITLTLWGLLWYKTQDFLHDRQML